MSTRRHFVEHKGLPLLLFGKKDFPQSLLDRGGEIIVELYKLACQMGGMKESCPYRAEEFIFDLHAMAGGSDDRMFLVITMPKAKYPTECERVYVCWHRNGNTVGYFTVEKSFGASMLCSWDKGGRHNNFGPAPATADEQLQRVMELFN